MTFNEIQLLTWNDLNFWMISPFRIQKENQKTNWLSSSIEMILNTDKALVQFFSLNPDLTTNLRIFRSLFRSHNQSVMKSTFWILQQVLQFIEYYVNLQIDKNNNNNNNNNNNDNNNNNNNNNNILIIII